jgi:hypothetical protein
MIKQAKQGDTLIVTFSGHGGRIPDIDPFDEKVDNHFSGKRFDEIYIFHDFNPDKSPQGSIIDDEMNVLLKEASTKYNIVFVADACYSGGAVRKHGQESLPSIRNGGIYDSKYENSIYPPLRKKTDKKQIMDITWITATETDSKTIQEVKINKQWHGALSWYFAQALKDKAADDNQDGYLGRKELEDFLREKIKKIKGHKLPKVQLDIEKIVIKDMEVPIIKLN